MITLWLVLMADERESNVMNCHIIVQIDTSCMVIVTFAIFHLHTDFTLLVLVRRRVFKQSLWM